MQLKLLPPHPLPTVLFTLTYPAPPSNLPLPSSYAHLLKLIVEENLLDSDNGVLDRVDGPLPLSRLSGPGVAPGVGVAAGVGGTGQGSLTPHALDKATWISAVLSEVVFDLSGDGAKEDTASSPAACSPVHSTTEVAVRGNDAKEDSESEKQAEMEKKVRVVCRYVDGREVEWTWIVPAASTESDLENDDIRSARACYAALQSVLSDVTESATAGERERRERERRHTYHERYAYEATHPFASSIHAAVGAERYDRYPAAVKPRVPIQRRSGMAVARSYSFDDARQVGSEREEERRKSFDEEMGVPRMGQDSEAHVPGFVETRRGKGRKNKESAPKEEKDAKDGKEGKGRHKKQRSLLMSLVAFAYVQILLCIRKS